MPEQKKPKFKVGDKVVITSMYPDGGNSNFEDGSIVFNKQYEIAQIAEFAPPKWATAPVIYLKDCDSIVDESMFTLASEYYKEQQMDKENISLDNTKINVVAYAEQHSIKLEQANKEVIQFIEQQGYTAFSSRKELAVAVFLHSDKDYARTYLDEIIPYGFEIDGRKEIFLERNILLTIKQEPDTISFDGKKYIKEEFLKAIKNLNVVD